MKNEFQENEKIRAYLKKIFCELGIIITDNEDIIEVDSYTFVNLIIEIENVFLISIEEDMLTHDKLHTFSDYVQLVECHVNNLDTIV